MFELGDELVALIRKMDPEAVPPEYRFPSRPRNRWTAAPSGASRFPRRAPRRARRRSPSARAAVFSLVPWQAARMLTAEDLETAAAWPASTGRWRRGGGRFSGDGRCDRALGRLPPATAACSSGKAGSMPRWNSPPDERRRKPRASSSSRSCSMPRCPRCGRRRAAYPRGATVTHWQNLIRDLPRRWAAAAARAHQPANEQSPPRLRSTRSRASVHRAGADGQPCLGGRRLVRRGSSGR